MSRKGRRRALKKRSGNSTTRAIKNNTYAIVSQQTDQTLYIHIKHKHLKTPSICPNPRRCGQKDINNYLFQNRSTPATLDQSKSYRNPNPQKRMDGRLRESPTSVR
jgi:hypothetical protein